MSLTQEQIKEQKQQAEELLFSDDEQMGFAKTLFFGKFRAPLVFPYPEIPAEQRAEAMRILADVQKFADEKIDPEAIDRNEDIPADVIQGLAELGVLGMTAPKEFGGRAMSQLVNTKVMEIIGARCSSTAVFVNAHHSIGIRALLLFGSKDQQQQWLPDLVAGRKLAAFALTEVNAGSDAANVQTKAVPGEDGSSFRLTGDKRYITNGGIAQVLTVMARTPVPGSDKTQVTAFLVSPDMAGFEVVEERMPKVGIRGTATARLAFHDMPVPAENILGPLGKGLRVALTVLDFGRVTFGASCTGAAKFCVQAAVNHARNRVQFKQKIGEFELVKKKIAWMAAHAFAIESTTAQCAAFIDRGADDYMLETAMLKVFSTDALWTIINDTIQIYGGKAYFNDEPFERMMRDARINMIGEGANDVLKAFIAVVGLRGVGESLKGVQEALKHPLKEWSKLWSFGKTQMAARLSTPTIPVQNAELRPAARSLAARVRDFGIAVQDVLINFRSRALKNRHASGATNGATNGGPVDEELLIAEVVLKSQHMQERLAEAACDLYASSCTLSHMDHLITRGKLDNPDYDRQLQAGRHFLTLASRRIKRNIALLWDNDDEQVNQTADTWLMP